MSKIEDLIERLEKATGPDRELDRAIWAYLHGRTTIPKDIDRAISRYTESMDAALTLKPEGAEIEFSDLYGTARAGVGLNFEAGPYYGEHKGGSIAIALCIAALRARLAEKDGRG